MKRLLLNLSVTSLLLELAAAPAQSTQAAGQEAKAEALELLRHTIQVQQDNPGRVVRTFTNLPPETASRPPSPKQLELERQYVEGKITAKQYQRELDRLKEQERKQAADPEGQARVLDALRKQEQQRLAGKSAKPARKPAVPIAASPKATVGSSPTPIPPAFPTPPPDTTAEDERRKKLTEFESRLDVMMREKAAREAARSNSLATTPATTSSWPTRRRISIISPRAGAISSTRSSRCCSTI